MPARAGIARYTSSGRWRRLRQEPVLLEHLHPARRIASLAQGFVIDAPVLAMRPLAQHRVDRAQQLVPFADARGVEFGLESAARPGRRMRKLAQQPSRQGIALANLARLALSRALVNARTDAHLRGHSTRRRRPRRLTEEVGNSDVSNSCEMDLPETMKFGIELSIHCPK